MMSKSTTCLFLLIGVAVVSAAPKCHMEEFEACGQPLRDFREANGNKLPVTEEQAEELCNGLKKAYDCVEDFQNRCMTPMQLQMMGFFTEGSIHAYNEFCESKSDLQTKYLKDSPCINQVFETDEYKGFASYVEAGMETVPDKEPNEKLPTVCCGYQWLIDRSTKLGTEKCGKEAVDTFLDVVKMAASSLPEVLCQGFEPDSERCKKVLPPLGTKPTGSLKNSHIAQMFTELYLKN